MRTFELFWQAINLGASPRVALQSFVLLATYFGEEFWRLLYGTGIAAGQSMAFTHIDWSGRRAARLGHAYITVGLWLCYLADSVEKVML